MYRMWYLIFAVFSLPIVLQHYYCQGADDDDCRNDKTDHHVHALLNYSLSHTL